MVDFVPLATIDPATVEALLDRAFGEGRHQRTAYKVRGDAHPLVMIGPVAVEPERQRDGLGRMLMTHALNAAAAQGLDEAMMLIGDPDYYSRFFGFDAAATTAWRLPGPVERERLLAKGRDVPAVAGVLGPRDAADA